MKEKRRPVSGSLYAVLETESKGDTQETTELIEALVNNPGNIVHKLELHRLKMDQEQACELGLEQVECGTVF